MMTAWSYLFVLQWALVEPETPGFFSVSSAESQALVVAVTASLVIDVLLISAVVNHNELHHVIFKEFFKAVALVCAWSWESFFDKFIESFHGEGHHLTLKYKVLFAVGFPCLVAPFYLHLRNVARPAH